MKRSRQVLLLMAVLVLCAGVVVGRLSARLSAEVPPQRQGHPPSWLADQLNLSADQQQKMDAIWADVKQQVGNDWDKHRELDRERDEAIRDLLSDEQQVEYQEIYDIYRQKRQEMEKTRDALIKSAEDRSRNLLNDSQKAVWDQMTKDMHTHRPGGPGHGPGPGPGMGGGMGRGEGRGPGFGPTSRWSGDHGPPDGDRSGDHGGDHGGDHP
jgi:Spy/CpxP family protein refolding chaperone